MAQGDIEFKAWLDASGVTSGVAQADKAISGLSKNIASALGGAGKAATIASVAIVAAGVASVGALTAIGKAGLDAALQIGEELDKLSDMFGMNAKQADTWATALRHFGVPVEEGAQQLNFFTRGLAETIKVGADGKKTLTPFGEALDKLGVKAFDAKGKLKTFDQIMPEIMDHFKKLPASVDKSNMAMDLFGARGGSKMLDFLSSGSEALAEATKRVDQFGGMTDEQRDSIEDFGFALNDMRDNIKKVLSQIGLAVLPTLRRFVDYINAKVLPVIAKWVKDYMPKIKKALEDFVGVIRRNVLPFIQRLVDAFQAGGLSGIFSRIVAEIQNAIPAIISALQALGTRFWDWLTGRGGALEQVGVKLGQIAGAIQTWLAKNSPAIIAAFDALKTRFWNWLTGKGGALEKAGEQLGKIITDIQKWAESHAPEFEKIFETWKTNFWNWLTDPQSGVIASVAGAMGKLTKNIRDWSEDPKTQKQFQDIGESIARAIIDGIGNLFSQKDEGESLLTVLHRNIESAYFALLDSFRNIGRNLAIGIIRGILSEFTSPARAAELANAIVSAMQQAVTFIMEWGNLAGLMRNLASYAWNQFIAAFKALMSFFDPFGMVPPGKGGAGTSGVGGTSKPRPGMPGSGVGGYARGGYVPSTGLAFLHAGEYVMNLAQVAALNSARTTHQYNARYDISGNSVSNVDMRKFKRLIEDTTNETLARRLG